MYCRVAKPAWLMLSKSAGTFGTPFPLADRLDQITDKDEATSKPRTTLTKLSFSGLRTPSATRTSFLESMTLPTIYSRPSKRATRRFLLLLSSLSPAVWKIHHSSTVLHRTLLSLVQSSLPRGKARSLAAMTSSLGKPR